MHRAGVVLVNTNGGGRQALHDYATALARTNALIEPGILRKRPEEIRARAELRLARLRRLLAALGDPHRAYRVIHVAGTSGKGSTAAAAAAILRAAGVSTGLHTSPYLQVATEKLQIGELLIDATSFRAAVEEVLATAERAELEPITYGETWFALAALALAKAGVEVAVIEVGAGGRFDLTNVVEPAVSVITSIGLDHQETLGATIPEIAWHKAGIIKPGAPVVTAVADPLALPVIEREAARTGSEIVRVASDGDARAINAETALAAVGALPGMSERLTPDVIRAGLSSGRLPGRFELVQASPAVMLDGAHNPQKMRALAAYLRTWRPAPGRGRLIALFGALESKAHTEMLAELAPVADELIFASPRVLAKPDAPASSLAESARAIGFAGRIVAVDNPVEALDIALSRAGPEDAVIVTGSLYLVGNVRGRWYPDDQIVIQRTPWPR